MTCTENGGINWDGDGNASDNNQFGKGTPGGPGYSTEASNGWGSSHWKSFSYGSIPELLWEQRGMNGERE